MRFVESSIQPHLWDHGLDVYPSILRARSGSHRGGRVTIGRLVDQVSREYCDAGRVTTLVDFYGFKDRAGRSRAEVEDAILDGVRNKTEDAGRRFDARFVLPYLQMHEFEGLLFSDIEQFKVVLDGWNDGARNALRSIRDAFDTPEDINDSPETAPSKRILEIFGKGAYSKTEHGPLIAKETGLAEIRRQCPRFDEWIGKLEAWGAQ